MSRFFCLFIPDFPAWAVARSDTALREKPFVISSRGKVLAASPQARLAGVQTDWSVPRAQALVPTLLAVPHHAATTQSAWQEALASLSDLTPQIESIRPGLAFAQLQPERIIVPLLREWHGHGGAAQGGSADDRTTAELAALTSQPGCLRSIRPGRSHSFLRQVPIPVLHNVGVSARATERMGWFGWKCVAQLRALSRQQLVAQFPEGETLFRYAQAHDVRPVTTYNLPPMIRVRHVLEQGDGESTLREPGEIEPILQHLLDEAGSQLNGRCAGALAVGLQTHQGWIYGRRLLREEAGASQSFHSAGSVNGRQFVKAEQHLAVAAHLALEVILPRAAGVTGVEVQLSALTTAAPGQGALFNEARPPVENALSAVEHRFPGMMRRVVLLEKEAYLPEDGFRLEPMILACRRLNLPIGNSSTSRPISSRQSTSSLRSTSSPRSSNRRKRGIGAR